MQLREREVGLGEGIDELATFGIGGEGADAGAEVVVEVGDVAGGGEDAGDGGVGDDELEQGLSPG